MKLLIKSTFLMFLLGVGTPPFAAESIEISGAWVREGPPTSRVLAAYMDITNHGDAPAVITAVSSPDFERVEIHRTEMSEGMMRMMKQDQLEIGVHKVVHLKPGGYHLMLIKPVKALRSGDSVELQLQLADQPALTIQAPVQKSAGGDNHGHQDMDMPHSH
jgi:copper(I)-binding protein